MTRLEKIASLYVATFGQTPSPEELDSYVYADHIALESIASTMAQAEGAMAYPDTSEATVKAAFQNTFGYTNTEMDALVQKQGFQYWVTELEDNPFITEETLSIALLNGAAQTDQDKATAIVADAVAAYENDQGGTQDPADDGSQFVLTDGRDTMEGTDGDDTFIAEVGQNQDGSVANAFATGDVIEGGMGNDAIEATMINDNEVDGAGTQFFPRPITDSVEEISIDALEAVTLDADRLDGADHYISNNSRGDLTVTNVNILDSQITEDITVEMNSTQQNADMAVYFNESSLRSAPDEESGSSVISMRLADGSSETDPQAPLENIVLDLSFTQGTHTYEITDVEATDGTYAGMRDAIETALTNEGLTGFTVELGDTFNTFDNFDVDPEGQRIEISSETNEDFDNVEFTPSPKSGANKVVVLADSETDTQTATNTYKVTGDVVLDDVGRGSDGGELLVGSMSGSATSTGIQVFNVTVEKDSVLHDISTTNGTLEQINLTNGDVKGDFVLTNGDYENTYGDSLDNGTFIDGLESMTASDFEGDITLGRDADIMNLGELDADVSGDVTYNATMGDGFGHSVTTGGGDDTHTVSLENSSDLAIDMGNGANSLTLTETGGTSTADITGGSGVDTVNGGAVSITANTGNGDDVVYAENTGDKAVFAIDTGATVETSADDIYFLYGRQVQVTLATNNADADGFANGFESELVDIATGSAGLTSRDDLNEAIVSAVNDNDQLSKVATADIVNDSVIVTYDVDGAQAATSVEVKFFGDDWADLSSTEQSAIMTEWRDMQDDSEIAEGTIETAYDAAIADGTSTLDSGYVVDAGNYDVTEATPGEAAVPAEYTIDLAGAGTDTDGDELTFDTGAGAEVVYTEAAAGSSDTEIADSLAGGTVNLDGVDYDVTQPGGAGSTGLVLTAQTAVNETDDITIAVNDADNSAGVGFSQPTTSTFTTTTDGNAQVQEVQEVDLSSVTIANGDSVTFTIDGTDVTYTNSAGGDLSSTALVSDIVNNVGTTAAINNTANSAYTFTDGGSGSLTITQEGTTTTADIPEIAVAGTGIVDDVILSGSNSLNADNANTVEAAAGDDTVVLSSDATATDTVVYSGYNQGDDTIVHFTANDELDFTSYLTGTVGVNADGSDTSSDSDESEVALNIKHSTDVDFAANSINVLGFSDLDGEFDAEETFEAMTVTDIEGALNELSAVVENQSEFDSLYQNNGKAVLIVQDDTDVAAEEYTANDGQYSAYEVTFANEDTAAGDGDFDVKLIGTMDFGEAVTLNNTNFTDAV